jgi:hypothetical protein
MHLRQTGGRPLSGTARLLILAAFDLWDQRGHALLGEMLELLDADHMERLFGLVLAVKKHDPEALDEWLGVHDPGARVRPIRN